MSKPFSYILIKDEIVLRETLLKQVIVQRRKMYLIYPFQDFSFTVQITLRGEVRERLSGAASPALTGRTRCNGLFYSRED